MDMGMNSKPTRSTLNPSPAPREREGPDPQGREGEGLARIFAGETLTRRASLATLSRNAGEGQELQC
jgi:hypothetical protein